MKYSKDTLLHFIWRYRYFEEDNKTPVFHYDMVEQYLTDNGSHTKPIKAFRGSAKTTNTAYMALYRIEEGASYTLIVSDTATQAESIVADITQMVEDSNVPYKIVRAVQGELQLSYKGKSYYIVGKGAGSSMRGVKRGRKRPDLIILDDIINDELVMNRLRVDRLNRWYFKALLPSLDPKGEVWAVGTPLSQNDLFMKLCSLHETLEIPIVNKDGNPSWEDRFPKEWIVSKKKEYENAGMLREWKQEFELVITDAENRLFDMDKIRFVDDYPTGLNWVLVCDLAISEASSADYSALVAVGLDERTGKLYIYPTQGRWKPSEVSREIFRLVDKFGIIDVGIEQGATYLAVKEHIDKQMLDYQTYFNVVELKHQGKAKISRIKSLEPIVNSGRMVIIDNGEASEVLVEQMELTDLEACRATHDDIIDAVAYLTSMNILSGDIELNNHLQSEYEEIESRYDKDYGFALSD